ncbi:MAG: AAA family ATPase, partial [Bacteroidetes bacterium]|nr:AAA family ATPase [Bacteroidota bacterium]
MTAHESILDLQARMGQMIVGQKAVIERLVIVLLANGNLLMEGLPGLGKTRAIKSLGNVLEVGLSRIQFTPDLMPSDITGTEIYQQTPDGQATFEFQPGPIFNNLILADEINRAPAKVQAALLEAMEERTVTVGGTTHTLPELFLVMATQNPIDQEGTYPLPEAQMDRFLMHVMVDYPDEAAEATIMRLVRSEEGASRREKDEEPEPRIPQEAIFEARQEIRQVHVAEGVEQYITALIA